jgi:hypothetical protein
LAAIGIGYDIEIVFSLKPGVPSAARHAASHRLRVGDEDVRRSAAISPKLRLLRAHGLLQKLAHTQRYQVTEKVLLILTHFSLLDMTH